MGVTLKSWLEYNHSEEDIRKAFYNMSRTMKYIHNHGFYIKTFNLKEIELLNLEKLNPIQYNTIVRCPEEELDEKKRENIYNLAFMHIGITIGIPLENLNPKFLKENFEQEFSPLLPVDDINYFRGIVTRGARVYYCDYIEKKNEQEIEKLESLTDGGNKKGIQKTKSTSAGRAFSEKETRKLYSDIDRPEAAFVNLLAFPIMMIMVGIIMTVILMLN